MGSAHAPTPGDDDAEERELRKALGLRLRRCRKEKGMTMVRLGQRAHCSQSFLSKVESGSIIPSIPMLHRLASVLGVRPSALLGEPGPDPTDGGPRAEDS